jgi:NAD(P)-dependent dehydrogenase (short-subunit alcohol dehydrogenase family)
MKALVLGNSRGIGLAISEDLKKEGIEVPNISRAFGYDLMTEEGINKLFNDVKDIDILIGNVGGMGTCKLDEFEEVMKKNYFINVKVLLHYLPYMITKEWGRVIFISSIYGKQKGPNPGFTAAKAAQIAFIKSMSNDICYKGITFNCICPGYIDVGKSFFDCSTLSGKPKDVSNLVSFLCKKESSHIDGAAITVDGGSSWSF